MIFQDFSRFLDFFKNLEDLSSDDLLGPLLGNGRPELQIEGREVTSPTQLLTLSTNLTALFTSEVAFRRYRRFLKFGRFDVIRAPPPSSNENCLQEISHPITRSDQHDKSLLSSGTITSSCSSTSWILVCLTSYVLLHPRLTKTACKKSHIL